MAHQEIWDAAVLSQQAAEARAISLATIDRRVVPAIATVSTSWGKRLLTHDSVNVRAMKISLTPRTTEFFVLFTKAGENALDVARLVERRFREYPNSDVTQEQVKAGETAGDVITRDLIVLLNTQYLTPFDREDIYLLATEIDDVVDYLEEASDLLGLYGVEMPARRAVVQCGIIVKAVEQLSIACSNLKGMRGVQEALIELKSSRIRVTSSFARRWHRCSVTTASTRWL